MAQKGEITVGIYNVSENGLQRFKACLSMQGFSQDWAKSWYIHLGLEAQLDQGFEASLDK